MQATYGANGANRLPGRFVEISAAALIALAIGGAGGYIAKGLASVVPVTVTNPARIAPTFQAASADAIDRAVAKAVGADAVDRAIAKVRGVPTLLDDSHLTISQNEVPTLRDSHLTISQDATLSARKARNFN
jgi:hypothetical protein